MSVVAYRDIAAGEEVNVSYNYDIQKAPQWYRVRFLIDFLTLFFSIQSPNVISCLDRPKCGPSPVLKIL